MTFIGRESSLPLFITERILVITPIGHPESKRNILFLPAASRLQEHINVVSYGSSTYPALK